VVSDQVVVPYEFATPCVGSWRYDAWFAYLSALYAEKNDLIMFFF
jgi:hypothetical protein